MADSSNRSAASSADTIASSSTAKPPILVQKRRTSTGSTAPLAGSSKFSDKLSIQALRPIDLSLFPESFLSGPSGSSLKLLFQAQDGNLSIYQQVIFFANKELPLDKIVHLSEGNEADGPLYSLEPNLRSSMRCLICEAQPVLDAYLLSDVNDPSPKVYDVDPKLRLLTDMDRATSRAVIQASWNVLRARLS
ncbi:hypothetical protein EWM64_g3017 [Hericium alpestre]|uniref:Uncharacterized protein n=1 Tax=Hericium alpestre TaxID=135208 RepID=A0A4Z0A5M8_9AGAM|nr:hypothetical protein EWM64_g3017 [Hericium alpestre]